MPLTYASRQKFEAVCGIVGCDAAFAADGRFAATTAAKFDGLPWASSAAFRALWTYLGPPARVHSGAGDGVLTVTFEGENGSLEMRGFLWGGRPREDLAKLGRALKRFGVPPELARPEEFTAASPWGFRCKAGIWSVDAGI